MGKANVAKLATAVLLAFALTGTASVTANAYDFGASMEGSAASVQGSSVAAKLCRGGPYRVTYTNGSYRVKWVGNTAYHQQKKNGRWNTYKVSTCSSRWAIT